jgi:hypothetical protein
MFEQIPPRQKSQPQRQRVAFGNVSIPGTKAGAVVSIGLVVVAWIAVPLARPFILGTVGVGALIGWFLWWLHSRE